MHRHVIRDCDLYSYLLGPPVTQSVRWLGERFRDSLDETYQGELHSILHFLEEDPSGAGPEEKIEALYAKMPANLAERLHGALNVYRAFGTSAFPGLLPLANRLLEAEMLLYVRLKQGGKPYRDHLGHQTRVASLAHLVMCGTGSEGFGWLSQLLPEPLRLPHVLGHRWRETREFHLLRKFALRRGLDLPDPELDGEAWMNIIGAAALLAGLVHDIGYVHKSLSELTEPVALTFDAFRFLPHASEDLASGLDGTPLDELYRLLVRDRGPTQQYERLSDYLRHKHQEIHSLVGAVWLASLERQTGVALAKWRETTSGDGELHAERSHVLICFHLASMLAFTHDLALTDDERRAELGLRVADKGGGRDETKSMEIVNFEEFPLCTLFALVDVCQEFGRLLRVVDGSQIGYIVPLVGLGMRRLDAETPQCERIARELHWGLTCPRQEQLLLSFGSRDSRADEESLLSLKVRKLRGKTAWEEDKVGDKIPGWLKAVGLSPYVALDGAPGALARINKRFDQVWKWRSDLEGMANAPNREVRSIRDALGALGDFLGVAGSGADQRRSRQILATLSEWKKGTRETPFPFSPLFDLADNGVCFHSDPFGTLVV